MKFNIKCIATILTGRLYSAKHMNGIYEILDFLTGESLMTYRLPVAANFCKQQLNAQLPEETQKFFNDWVHTDDWKEKLEAHPVQEFELTPVNKEGFENYMLENSLLK